MNTSKWRYPLVGELNHKGYLNKIVDYTIHSQLLDKNLWSLFVRQFEVQLDSKDGGWRGEYWGKMMRGGALTYRLTGDKELYSVLSATVCDLLSKQESSGRVSSYNKETEFQDWDMWGRKYVMLGLEYFFDVCINDELKQKIIEFLKSHADYILEYIGEGENKKDILDTSRHIGAMNSCSILEPFVKLYVLTNEVRYLDFAKYIINSGFCKGDNLINECLYGNKYPYEFKERKAYEMMSCFEGLLEYYKVLGNDEYLVAVKNFVDRVIETDFTLVGGAGTDGEFFNNSKKMQTKKIDIEKQETCVSVTLMKLCAKLLEVTGEEKYAEIIECIAYNIMSASVNTENQTMIRAENVVQDKEVLNFAFPFDSYNPIYQERRSKLVGGFKIMQNEKAYGCCACIGSAGTAIANLFCVMKSDNAICINAYDEFDFSTKILNKKVSISVNANPYGKECVKIKINGNNEKFSLYLRVPKYANNYKISVNGKHIKLNVNNGYAVIEKVWNNDCIIIRYDTPVTMIMQDDKCAYKRGAIVLAGDARLCDIYKPVFLNSKNVKFRLVKNKFFSSNIAVKIKTQKENLLLCDYSQAGKNYNDDNNCVSVWFDFKYVK